MNLQPRGRQMGSHLRCQFPPLQRGDGAEAHPFAAFPDRDSETAVPSGKAPVAFFRLPAHSSMIVIIAIMTDTLVLYVTWTLKPIVVSCNPHTSPEAGTRRVCSHTRVLEEAL